MAQNYRLTYEMMETIKMSKSKLLSDAGALQELIFAHIEQIWNLYTNVYNYPYP